ncbi:hypothetical protein [Pseudoalteromonas shioyasakiensis]|uniref:hypothetical protein n=1 Tax=Pseudoalteromonas shioyasakiensis TaxID=1190813 RepID=UPI000781623B|nr:hypothetical protein [Pseudoalteromonas shioyasakiensis]
MGTLAKLFDTYSLRARIKPAAFIVLPIALSIITFYEPARTAGGVLITFLTSFGVMSYTANQMSTQGNIVQKRLFNKWGGSPSTILLRYSNDEIDVNTKQRYQKFLSKHIPGYEAITPEEEAANPLITERKYESAIKYLLEHTRDKQKYNLIFSELITYGYSRNTFAFKWLSVVISSSSLIVSSMIIYLTHLENKAITLKLIFTIPFEQTALVVFLLLLLFNSLFLVNENWVRVRAFAYGKRLLAACDKID